MARAARCRCLRAGDAGRHATPAGRGAGAGRQRPRAESATDLVGLEPQRLALLLAVLNRHAGIATFEQDVFINAVGGVRIEEPAADMAVLLAIVSSIRNKPLRVAWWPLVKSGSPAKSGRHRASRSACARRPSWAFRWRSFPRPTRRQRIEGLTVVAVDRLDRGN